jgi:exodeoxyribonuclease VII large subunit
MTSKPSSSLVADSALSVAGLTAYIQLLLEQDDHLRQVWVTGEVSSASQYPSGLFFTLQDPDVKAAISCVVWSSQLHKLATVPTPGEQLILLGRVHVQPKRGGYQLVVWQSLPAGEGLRALRYRQLKDRLEAEGLFDPDLKRPLPPHPQTVAVVTSPQAAAWGDIRRTLKSRYPGLRVLFAPALVQGEQAPVSIAHAIARVERDCRADVLILSRGGGAVEDLACFNDEIVVRAIATCPIPVIAGIGHQRDESLADLAADVCAHTPTAAAELAVPALVDLHNEHLDRAEALMLAVNRYLRRESNRLQGLRDRADRLPLDRLIKQETERVSWLKERLVRATQRRFETATNHCRVLGEKLASLDPQIVLQRGYAIARSDSGTIVRSSSEVSPGETLTIQLGQGQIQVTVTE